ncbi:MAG: right-handed parallel beta-helix repeat-containing protein [Planctomycetes bacterium]|nr:right-handed parallel beta-helix repeat-containing protein [Planctomycetota bacterium]
MKAAPTLFALALVSSIARGGVWYVDHDNCPGPGSGSKEDPFCSIGQAISVAAYRDLVLVAPGLYHESLVIENVTLRSDRDLDPATVDTSPYDTIIDGSTTALSPTLWCLGSRSTVLEGFTIRGGTGMWLLSHPYLEALGRGGGILSFGSPTIRGNIIRDNDLRQNVGSVNRAWGAGIFCNAGSPLIQNNVFYRNTTAYDPSAGGMGYGGGLCCDAGAAPTIINNTFCENAATSGGGIWCEAGASPVIVNTILWKNDAANGPEIEDPFLCSSVTFCNVRGGWPGRGNIHALPAFVEPAAGDFHLLSFSPCRDAGLDLGGPAPPSTDFEGDPRSATDIGADEFHAHLYFTGDPSPGATLAAKITGTPGASPVLLAMGSGVLQQPTALPPYLGSWWLDGPYVFIVLGPMPAAGCTTLGLLLPVSPPSYCVPLQAIVREQITNPCIIHAK